MTAVEFAAHVLLVVIFVCNAVLMWALWPRRGHATPADRWLERKVQARARAQAQARLGQPATIPPVQAEIVIPHRR